MRHYPREGVPPVRTPRGVPDYIDDGENFRNIDATAEQEFFSALREEKPISGALHSRSPSHLTIWDQMRDLIKAKKRVLDPEEEKRLFRYYNYLRFLVASGEAQSDTGEKIRQVEDEILTRNVGLIMKAVFHAVPEPRAQKRLLATQIAVVQALQTIRRHDCNRARFSTYYAIHNYEFRVAEIRGLLEYGNRLDFRQGQVPVEALLAGFLPYTEAQAGDDTAEIDWNDLENWLLKHAGADRELVHSLIYSNETLEAVGERHNQTRERVRQKKEDLLNALFVVMLKNPEKFSDVLENMNISLQEDESSNIEQSPSVLLEELILAAELSDRQSQVARLYLQRILQGGDYDSQLKSVGLTRDQYNGATHNTTRKLIQAARLAPNPGRYRKLVLLLAEPKRGKYTRKKD